MMETGQPPHLPHITVLQALILQVQTLTTQYSLGLMSDEDFIQAINTQLADTQELMQIATLKMESEQ